MGQFPWLLRETMAWLSVSPLDKSRGQEGRVTYDEMVILVPVSCSIFFRFLPSLPISLPTKPLWAKIFRGTSSALEDKAHSTLRTDTLSSPEPSPALFMNGNQLLKVLSEPQLTNPDSNEPQANSTSTFYSLVARWQSESKGWPGQGELH